jgi:hypothetical protein
MSMSHLILLTDNDIDTKLQVLNLNINNEASIKISKAKLV